MTPPRTILLACAASAACLAGAAPAAHAGVPSTPFTVAPATAGTSSVITATWKVDRRLKRGERFGFEMSIVAPDGSPFPGIGSGYNCTTDTYSPARVVKKGAVLRATFRPGLGRDGPGRWKTWCPGTARIVLNRYPRGDDTNISRFLGLRTVPITLAPGETLPYTATPVKITLMPGSTVTATAAGRPDRTTPVTGVLRGGLDAPFLPVGANRATSLAGTLTPASFAPDPLCPGSTPPASFSAAPGTRLDMTTQQTVSAQGAVSTPGTATFTLSLNGAPSQIFGCGPPGALAGTTTLTLTGTAGPRNGFGAVSVTGAAPGFALPDGTQGGLAATLVLNVDLSGRS